VIVAPDDLGIRQPLKASDTHRLIPNTNTLAADTAVVLH
jgi:hypothetical protein